MKNIVVCVKQIPATADIGINAETNSLIREGVQSMINPLDLHAIEEALRLKEKYGGTVICITMGPPHSEQALRDALSLGVDKVYLLTDSVFTGADTLATSYVLSKAIEKICDVDLVLFGDHTFDGDTGQVGPGVAEHLKIPHATSIVEIENISSSEEGNQIVFRRLLEEGYLRLKGELPLCLAVLKDINEPRMPSIRNKLKSKKVEIEIWDSKYLEAVFSRCGFSGSPTEVVQISRLLPKTGNTIYTENPQVSISMLLKDLKENGVSVKVRMNSNYE